LDTSLQEGNAGCFSDGRLSHPAYASQKTQAVRGLQRTYGNAYVQRLLKSKAVQAKLTVNPPDDQYEREADRVAATITQTPEPRIQGQTEAEEEDEKVQMKLSGSKVPEVSQELETRINAARSSGQPLTESARASLESHLQRDLSHVRIHTDAEADKLSQHLEAKAFTTGQDVFFRDGAYQPGSEIGKNLLGHEMTHVVQQSPALTRQQPSEKLTAPSVRRFETLSRREEPLAPKREPEGEKLRLRSWEVKQLAGDAVAVPTEGLEAAGQMSVLSPTPFISGPLKEGIVLYPGSSITTGKKSRLMLRANDGSVISLGANSELTLPVPGSERVAEPLPQTLNTPHKGPGTAVDGVRG
jgi:hypothetical protein